MTWDKKRTTQIIVAGVTFEGRHVFIRQCREGDEATLVRDPTNAFDSHAIQVVVRGMQVGFVPKEQARTMAKHLDGGQVAYQAVVTSVYSFTLDDGRTALGMTIDAVKYVWVEDSPPVASADGEFPVFVSAQTRPAEQPTGCAVLVLGLFVLLCFAGSVLI